MSIDPTIDYSKRKDPPRLDPPKLPKPRNKWIPTMEDAKEWGYFLGIIILGGIIFTAFWTLVGVIVWPSGR